MRAVVCVCVRVHATVGRGVSQRESESERRGGDCLPYRSARAALTAPRSFLGACQGLPEQAFTLNDKLPSNDSCVFRLPTAVDTGAPDSGFHHTYLKDAKWINVP